MNTDYETLRTKEDIIGLFNKFMNVTMKESSKIKLKKVNSSKDVKY